MRTGVILGVLGAAVLALGLGLWKMTRDDPADPIAIAAGSAKPEPAPAADAEPLAPALPGKRDGKIAPPLIAPPRDAGSGPTSSHGGGGGPELAPTAPVDADIYTPRDREIKNLLRHQIAAIDQFVADCASKTGAKLTGMASSKFAIRRGATAGAPNVVEVTEFPDGTTVKDAQPFVDCLIQTGKHVDLDLPEGVVEVTGSQEVDLDAGAITEHKLSAFSVKTPGSP